MSSLYFTMCHRRTQSNVIAVLDHVSLPDLIRQSQGKEIPASVRGNDICRSAGMTSVGAREWHLAVRNVSSDKIRLLKRKSLASRPVQIISVINLMLTVRAEVQKIAFLSVKDNLLLHPRRILRLHKNI